MNGKRSYAELVAALVDKAREWREAEIYEFETDSCKEREERHCATNSALCQIRKAVFDLFPHLSNEARSQRLHLFDPIYNGADECECGLVQSASVHQGGERVAALPIGGNVGDGTVALD